MWYLLPYLIKLRSKETKKKYEDEPEFEIGFIANDIDDNITDLGFDNLVQKDSSNDDMMSLSYDRMVCVLWGALKQMKAEIATLKEQIKHL